MNVKKSVGNLICSLCNCKTNQEDEQLEVLKLKYEKLCYFLEEERDRRKTVEGKASIFIGTTSIMGAILVGCSKLIFDETDDGKIVNTFILVSMLVLVAILASTIWYSVKVLKKRTYWKLATNDLENIANRKQYYIEMISSMIKILKFNETVINMKVDNMELAHMRFLDFWLFSVIYILDLFVFKILNVYCIEPEARLLGVLFITIVLSVIGYLCLTHFLKKYQQTNFTDEENFKINELIDTVCCLSISPKMNIKKK